MFVSGEDSLSMQAGEDVLFGLFSVEHFLDLANIMILHSPLNLLAAAWIAYALIFYRQLWIKDKITLLLLFVLLGFGFELFIFNAKRGIFFDWDIFSFPGLLLPLTAFRLWEVCAPESARPGIVKAAAVLLPLAAAHLLLWGTTLHSRETMLKRLIKMEYSVKGKQMWASGLSSYLVEEDYLPDYIIALAKNDSEVRKFLLYRLCLAKRSDKALEIVKNWEEKLTYLDNNNLAELDFMRWL